MAILTHEYGIAFNPSLVESGGVGRFHELKQLENAETYERMLDKALNDDDLASAERILLDIDFTHAVNRKEYEARKTIDGKEVSISNYNKTTRDIEHIHERCANKILLKMKPMLEEELIVLFLEDLRAKYPSNKKELDLILCAIKGEKPTELCGD